MSNSRRDREYSKSSGFLSPRLDWVRGATRLLRLLCAGSGDLCSQGEQAACVSGDSSDFGTQNLSKVSVSLAISLWVGRISIIFIFMIFIYKVTIKSVAIETLFLN
jgi:hypothetical protein